MYILIYIKNYKGPRIDPCETPHCKLADVESSV